MMRTLYGQRRARAILIPSSQHEESIFHGLLTQHRLPLSNHALYLCIPPPALGEVASDFPFFSPHSASIGTFRRDLKPTLRLVRSHQFAIIREQHLHRVPGLQSHLIGILNLSQAVTRERMAQRVVFPFDSSLLRQLVFQM